MSKSAKQPTAALSAAPVPTAIAARPTPDKLRSKKADTGSKQSRVIAMLQSPTGTTIAAMMKATGWQQHSVRGFLAGVVRKRLKLKLGSEKVDGQRVYQIASARSGKSGAEGAVVARTRFATGSEVHRRRDHASAQSRRRVSSGPGSQDRSLRAAWRSGWTSLGLAESCRQLSPRVRDAHAQTE